MGIIENLSSLVNGIIIPILVIVFESNFVFGWFIIICHILYIKKRFCLHIKFLKVIFFIISGILISCESLLNIFSFVNEILLVFYFFQIVLIVFIFLMKPKDIPDIGLPDIDIKDLQTSVKSIYIGNAVYQRQYFKSAYLDLEDLKRHMIIYGQTGTGKTNFLKQFLIHFCNKYKNIPFLLFEFKNEFDDLIQYIPEIKILKPGSDFFINLFNPEIMKPEIYAEMIFDGLKSCKIINEASDFSPQMEYVLVDALKKTCVDSKQRSWISFLNFLDDYQNRFQNQIPQLNQTIIGLKNRLRRYYNGPLSTLFNSEQKTSKIIPLFSKKYIINLGNILNLGGTKEDVIFFANLLLKWIWEFNIRQIATNSLRHLTIFEDVSYIASKKLIESSKLSSYLEDIALLLRGKGEGLICLTTSIDISKNILLNAGSKFFFKFNEKLEDVLYILGLNHFENININNLQVGFCLTKLNSISNVFLLKIDELKQSLKNVNYVHNKVKLIDHFDKKKKKINPHGLNLKSKQNHDHYLRKIMNLLIEPSKIKFKNERQIIKHNFSVPLNIPQINNQSKFLTNFTLVLIHFNQIIGPEIYYELGEISSEIKHRLSNLVILNIGDFSFDINDNVIYMQIFEIDSEWNRGNKELLQICIAIKKDQIDQLNIIKQELYKVISKIKQEKDIFKAFYLSDDEYKKKNRDEIYQNSKKLKFLLKDFWASQNIEFKNHGSFSNHPDLVSLKNLINSLLENE